MKIRKYEKLVISICMLLVVSFALVTATYAWYAGTDPTILDALNLTLDDKGDLKVEIVLESGERMDMSQVDASGASIDLALSKIINIEENKLGPGSFGEVHIFVSSRSATYTSYNIKIIPNCDYRPDEYYPTFEDYERDIDLIVQMFSEAARYENFFKEESSGA